MKQVKIERVSDTAKMPTYGSEKAACLDLYADIPFAEHGIYYRESGVCIPPHTTTKIGIGFKIAPPEGYYGAIFARSGMATNHGLRPANCVGICDEDYRGQYIVALHNDSNDAQIIHHGDRIAQMMFVPYEQFELVETYSLDETERGAGGFGSTGV